MEVGVGALAEAGEMKSLRFREGVVWSLRWWVVLLMEGVVRSRLLGVCEGACMDDEERDLRLREGEVVVDLEGRGSLPERMSRSLLYDLYF
jgi:hypothetical protein